MIASPPAQVEHFRDLIAEHLGLQFEDAKLGFLAEVLERRRGRRETTPDYLRQLAAHASHEELTALALELTVPETYFFRNIEQFHALVEAVFPGHIRAFGASRPLRILSAGCASGEEPYTIAILSREILGDAANAVSIRGIDINSAMLEKALRGRYTDWALRETPPQMRAKWFLQGRNEAVLSEVIRKSVRFSQRNLVDDDAELWAPQQYDVVFCRNVLMYLAPKKAAAVLGRIARALAPGGYLFLGHAETLRGLSEDFHLCHTHETFYYQRKEDAAPAWHTDARRHQPAAAAEPLACAVEQTDSWVEVIRRASERVHALTRESPAAAPAAPPAWDIGAALEMLRQEHFGQALELVQSLPADHARSGEALLLTAVLSTHGGRLDEAEAACRQLLEIDELNAGAHYVLALCRESAGDDRGAADHDRTAAYLDPTFAMPRLHLGLLARRAGDRETSRRELAQAAILLQREDTSRLILFGGGFGRDSLLALAATESASAGEMP